MAAQELLEPEQLYKSELKEKHHETVVKAFEELTKKSGVDTEANGITCKKYYEGKALLEKLNKKKGGLSALKALFIILCFVLVGIFLLIFVYKPKRKELDKKIASQEEANSKLLSEAYAQMAALNSLFEASMPAKLMHKTTPLIEMDRIFDIKKYELLREKYGLWDNSDQDSSTLDLQSGSILGNPFVIFKDIRKDMVMQRYEGHTVISYTVRTGNQSYTRTETLTAYVEKPKPVYSKETYLVFASEAADRLSFSREPSKINELNEKEIDKYVRKHEKDLSKMAEKATLKGKSFTPLGNSEFELFFGGLDRDEEVQYRLLFTPLAQTSMLKLMKSKVGFGDDFKFTKIKGINVIESRHSQGTALFVDVKAFQGFDYEVMKKFFIEYNDNYFKCLFFDFAPLLSIPLYQQFKSHEYIYKNNVESNLNPFVHETIANRFNLKRFLHPDATTETILKTKFNVKANEVDVVNVTSHAFRTVKRVENVMKMGGDMRMHSVPVTWIEYIPVSKTTPITVTDLGIDDQIKFNSLGQSGVIYANGVVSGEDNVNVDINKLKSLMKKD